MFVTDKSAEACAETTEIIVEKLRNLGFKIHEEKSQFSPKKVVKFLGFMIDSEKMQAYLPPDKVNKMEGACTQVLRTGGGSIQEASSIVGLLNSYAKAGDYVDNHINRLEIDKVRALQRSGGSFDADMKISKKGEQDLKWWLQNGRTMVTLFDTKSPTSTLTTDASNEGWGAVLEGNTAQGRWLDRELELHINEKELLAVLFGLKTV